jgi:hypothetical protein
VVGVVVDITSTSASMTGLAVNIWPEVPASSTGFNVGTQGPATATRFFQGGSPESASQPLGPALNILNQQQPPLNGQRILDIQSMHLIANGNGSGASIQFTDAFTGVTTFDYPILVNGSKLVVSEYDAWYNNGGNYKSQTNIIGSSVIVRQETGSGNSIWSHRATTSGVEFTLESSGATALGAESWTTNFRMDPGRIGFYGHAPVARPVRPTTLADVIVTLTALGLTA